MLAAALFVLPTGGAAQQPTQAIAGEGWPVLAAADLRAGVDLDGAWHYSVDPYRAGLLGFHGGAPGLSDRRWTDVDVGETMRRDTRAAFEFDMDRAPVATLPGSWLTHAAELRHYQGLMWYQRHVVVHPTPGKRVFLRFGAVNYTARVFLNGRPVGQHEGGFTPFAFDVTAALRDGDNQVTVGVDSTATPASVPPPVTDWETYGGITRSVWLIETPETYVDDAWVRLTRTGRIAADIHLDGQRAGRQAVTLGIAALGVRIRGRTDASGNWHAELPVPRSLVRWSPDRPQLYDVTVTAGDDRWRDRVGFRTLATRGATLLLNDRPIFLRGISLHEEEFGPNPARIMTRAASRALLMEAKTGLHANYVRLAHYPHAEVTTRMADELGLLVWSEVPVYWLIDWANPATLATARRMVADNVRRDRNRASIAIWSVANETPVTDARNGFLGTLVGDIRALDDTRLVSAALLVKRTTEAGRPVMTLDDPLAATLDVLAVNTYTGWYGNDALSVVPKTLWRVPADRPLVLSEFGAGAKAGFHDTRAEPQKFSEEFQAAYYRATLAMTEHMLTLAGLSPWILKDFRSPRRQNGFQQGWNRKGLVSETGQRKQAFAVLADYYAARDAASCTGRSGAEHAPC